MLGAVARKLFGTANDRRIKGYKPRVDAINALEPELAKLSDDELRARTVAFRKELAEGKPSTIYWCPPSPRCARPANGRSGSGISTFS